MLRELGWFSRCCKDKPELEQLKHCLLYTSDAADE